MTNFEKYKEDILRIAAIGNRPALVNGELLRCDCAECDKCAFYNRGKKCLIKYFEWLYEEYKEPAPKLTLAESIFLKLICYDTHHYYICRDKNNTLWMHAWKPYKDMHYNQWRTEYVIQLDENFFKFIKWEDEKPWSISDLLKLEVEK